MASIPGPPLGDFRKATMVSVLKCPLGVQTHRVCRASRFTTSDECRSGSLICRPSRNIGHRSPSALVSYTPALTYTYTGPWVSLYPSSLTTPPISASMDLGHCYSLLNHTVTGAPTATLCTLPQPASTTDYMHSSTLPSQSLPIPPHLQRIPWYIVPVTFRRYSRPPLGEPPLIINIPRQHSTLRYRG